MNPVKLKDGKFYRNGIEEKPIFGDKDQIEAMAKAQEVFDALNGDGLEVEAEERVIVSVYFKCICGLNINFENDREEFEDVGDCMSGLIEKCSCGKSYKLIQNEDGFLAVKLTKEKKK